MIKIFGESLALPLKMIFEAALNDGVFPSDWKKGNIVPVRKKDLKIILINYDPISLLPIFAKIFEKIQISALANTGAIRGASQERIYSGLSLESLPDRRWYRKMVFF